MKSEMDKKMEREPNEMDKKVKRDMGLCSVLLSFRVEGHCPSMGSQMKMNLEYHRETGIFGFWRLMGVDLKGLWGNCSGFLQTQAENCRGTCFQQGPNLGNRNRDQAPYRPYGLGFHTNRKYAQM